MLAKEVDRHRHLNAGKHKLSLSYRAMSCRRHGHYNSITNIVGAATYTECSQHLHAGYVLHVAATMHCHSNMCHAQNVMSFIFHRTLPIIRK